MQPSRYLPIALLVLLVAVRALAVEPIPREWGPFRGQVVDLETEQPIAGAVMLVVWQEVYGFGFAGHRFYDALEAVTDGDGRFEIPKLTVPPWKVGVQAPSFHLFAPGYEPYTDIVTPVSGRVFLDPTVSQMRRLKSRDALLWKSRGYPSNVPPEKMTNYLKTINVETEMLGLGSLPIVPKKGSQP